jgi:phospholipid/cholesterol/gamma-HCH transport system permease protein
MMRAVLIHLGSILWLLIDTFREMGDHIRRGKAPFRVSQLFAQTDRAGVGSLPLVVLVSFFLGLTMALLTGYQLKSLGQERMVPALVTVAFTRELGPLITGIMVAGRVGAAFTAELGTMRVAEEVEAIEAMGLGSKRFLVAPRLMAVTLLTPALVVGSNLAALFGGALVCQGQFGVNFHAFFGEMVLEALTKRDVVAGMVKSLLFGLVVGLIACYKGLSVKGGAEGVGNATTQSVVQAIVTVLGVDTLSNIVLVALFE